MAIQYANLTYSFVVDDYVDLPAGAPPGQLAYVVSTAKAYYSTNGTWKEVLLAGAGGFQPYTYSFDNPPASPSAYDDEFDSTSLDGKWTAFSTGTANPVASGSVNQLSNLTTPIYDLATMSSWLLFQSDSSSAGTFGIYQDITLATDCTLFVKFAVNNRVISAINEGNVEVKLRNIADSNEAVYISCSQQGAGAGFAVQLTVENNGVFSVVIGPVYSEKAPVDHLYAVLWKNGNTYHAAFAHGSGPFSYLGSVTKTGVTTLDRMYVQTLTANETPSFIDGFDFVRYYPSITYALMN